MQWKKCSLTAAGLSSQIVLKLSSVKKLTDCLRVKALQKHWVRIFFHSVHQGGFSVSSWSKFSSRLLSTRKCGVFTLIYWSFQDLMWVWRTQLCKSIMEILPGFMLQPPPRGQQVVQVGGEEEVEEDNSKCRLDFSMFPLCQVWAKLVVPAFERVLEGWKEALQNPPSASSNTGTTTDVGMSRVCLVSNMDSRANKLINLPFSK